MTCLVRIWDISRTHLGHIEDKYWTYLGHKVEISGTYSGHIWDIPETCLGLIWDISEKYLESSLKYKGHALDISGQTLCDQQTHLHLF